MTVTPSRWNPTVADFDAETLGDMLRWPMTTLSYPTTLPPAPRGRRMLCVTQQLLMEDTSQRPQWQSPTQYTDDADEHDDEFVTTPTSLCIGMSLVSRVCNNACEAMLGKKQRHW